MLVFVYNGLDNFGCGGVRKVPVRFEKEIEYLPIGAEKGVAVLADEIAVHGNAVCSFLLGEDFRLAGVEAIDGKGGGEGVGRLERGAFGIVLGECAANRNSLSNFIGYMCSERIP